MGLYSNLLAMTSEIDRMLLIIVNYIRKQMCYIGDPNTEEDYALVLYFQAQDPVLEEFKDYMKNLTSKLEKEGYEIKNYEVENRIDEEVTSYKPYQMELHLNAKKEKLKRFRDYMNELFEKILRTKGIIVNYYSFKGEHELAGSY